MDKKTIELLKDKKRMKEESVFIIDTEKILDEAVAAGVKLEKIFFSEKGAAIAEKHAGIPAERSKKSDIERFSSVEQGRGFIAVARAEGRAIKDLKGLRNPVLLDRVQDPANVGAIIRSGLAFGFENYLLYDCAGIFNEKAVRASAGAAFRVNFRNLAGKDLNALKGNYRIIAAASDAETRLSAMNFTKDTLIVMGSEGSGISPEIEKLAETSVKIEYPGDVESLNVAAAAAIIFYECGKKSRRT